MKRTFLGSLLLLLSLCVCPQAQTPPDALYGRLFRDVQISRVFPDGKTFVDCVPKRDPAVIAADYEAAVKDPPPGFSLAGFVSDNFSVPVSSGSDYASTGKDAVVHVRELWGVLKRPADKPAAGSSLLPLPHPYIVPGGRFREVYYWDSYFTMLGLRESGETEMMENMVRNFSYLIGTYGHIPNGNRSYYLSRSQPPFFSSMVELLAEVKGNGVYADHLPALEKEYRFWMDGVEGLKPGESRRRVVRLKDGTVMNRYWDDSDAPRQESYREDVETAERAVRRAAVSGAAGEEAAEAVRRRTYRELRAGAESGLDFSSRWFRDGRSIDTIRTTEIVPVDLNCLLFHLETTLKRAYSEAASSGAGSAKENRAKAAAYGRKASARRKAVESYCWDEKKGVYSDYLPAEDRRSDGLTMAGMYPLFFGVAGKARAARQRDAVMAHLLRAGGFLTTTETTGQQWDAPNGWPPLQWIGIAGLERYGFRAEARDAALRWIKLNTDVFARTGKMMEKYDVTDPGLEAGGGEYPSQDGFGWTNGVLLKLISLYKK